MCTRDHAAPANDAWIGHERRIRQLERLIAVSRPTTEQFIAYVQSIIRLHKDEIERLRASIPPDRANPFDD